jgi:hypothetical protein
MRSMLVAAILCSVLPLLSLFAYTMQLYVAAASLRCSVSVVAAVHSTAHYCAGATMPSLLASLCSAADVLTSCVRCSSSTDDTNATSIL